MLTNRGSFLLRYGSALVSIALATWLRLLLDPVLGLQFPFATLFFAVLVAAWFGGFGPALLSSILGALLSSYFLLPPRGTFSVQGTDQYYGMLLYVIVSLGIAALGGAMRAAQRTAEASARAEQDQAALINQTHDAVLAWDWNGKITFWNRGAEQLYGIPRAEAVGRVSHDLLCTSTEGGVASFVSSLEQHGSWEGELIHTVRDGQRIVVESRMVLVRDSERAYVLEVDRDISKRRTAEGALLELNNQLEARVRDRTAELALSNQSTRISEERLAGIVNSAMDAIISVDSEQKIVLFNAAAERVFRCAASDVIGQPIDIFIPKQFREEHRRDVQRFGGTGVTSRSMRSLGTLMGLRADGEEFPIEASISQIEAAGQPLFTVILRDVTERRRAEEELRASEAKLQTIVENLTEGLAVSDLQGNLLHFNRAALANHGFVSLEEGRRHLTEFVDTFELSDLDGTVLPVDQWPLARILRGERVSGWEVRIRRTQADWRRVFNYGGTLVHDADGKPTMAVVTINDITERKRADEEIRQLNAELEQRVMKRTAELEAANRELEAFSYSVSHDLRAPLRAVDGFSKAVLEDYAPQLPQEGQRYLNTIRQSAQRMGELIDDLLTFSRLGRQPLKTRPVDMGKLVRSVIADMNGQLEGRQVEIRIQELPACQADPALLKQVWINLLSNALKFTGKQESAIVEVGSAQEHGENVFFVRDDGTGFDMRYAGKLFGVFQRLHRGDEFEGTGVGLAIVQRIIHRHGGRVWAEGAVGRGATFYFTLGGEENHD
jgi:PAS domain S-box-containing protein